MYHWKPLSETKKRTYQNVSLQNAFIYKHANI